MVTIYDIAKKTGYSVTTVSKALNNYSDVSSKTKRAILDAVEEMGYLPNSHARTLTTKKSWTIGVIFIESLGVGMKHPFFNAVIESFRKNVEVLGYDLLFASRMINNQQKSYLEQFKYRGVDGVVVVCSLFDDVQVKELMDSSIPTVVIDLHSKESAVVNSDNFAGSYKAVEYLYSLGHRSIAHIAGHATTFAGQERRNGFMTSMKTMGLDIPDEYVVNGDYFSREGGFKAMNQLLSLPSPPTAIFTAADSLAIGAMEAIKEAGYQVPDDFSVIGFDDIDLAQFINPPLTTVRQDTNRIGQESADLLIKQINTQQKIAESVVVPVDLVIRNSCKALVQEESSNPS
ncbi:substrate-binding domain-containing protein [Pontibacillus yanchengensis]|uniref:Substrate-binding domain-containing protein n=2 Tax=Pontibacillus yanchengensis TaxID=462910 RepID=A0ACC7VFC9_9BACI|nr:LacI family DNA-binding transcriptional regulator [Pontibacillus yanchengensis]MYL32051.1 substrate-binding domain-containing protein [Pontibacillus yanchengensis]MYL52629.1 substrate-binding domain-containing protein [Pontibacillus yanchengensis]